MRASTAVCILGAVVFTACSDAHLNLPPDVHDLTLEPRTSPAFAFASP